MQGPVVLSSGLRAGGFTMLEVLVAILIVAVGVLGLAGVQASAISRTNDAKYRSLAAIEAAGLAASMHANPAYWQNLTTSITQADVSATASCGSTQTCTASQVAGYDVSQWQQGLKTSQMALPDASGTFSCTPQSVSSPVSCQISIAWSEKRYSAPGGVRSSGSAYASASYSMVVQP